MQIRHFNYFITHRCFILCHFNPHFIIIDFDQHIIPIFLTIIHILQFLKIEFFNLLYILILPELVNCHILYPNQQFLLYPVRLSRLYILDQFLLELLHNHHQQVINYFLDLNIIHRPKLQIFTHSHVQIKNIRLNYRTLIQTN